MSIIPSDNSGISSMVDILNRKMDLLYSMLRETIAKTERMIKVTESVCSKLEAELKLEPSIDKTVQDKGMLSREIGNLPQYDYLVLLDIVCKHIHDNDNHRQFVESFSKHVPNRAQTIMEAIRPGVPSHMAANVMLQFLSSEGYKVSFIHLLLLQVDIDITNLLPSLRQ